MKNNKYFCDYCGYEFSSIIPEKDEFGLINDIPCPKCGSHCTYLNSEQNKKASYKRYCEEDAKEIERMLDE